MANIMHTNLGGHDHKQQHQQRFSNSNNRLQICCTLGIFLLLLLPILTESLYRNGGSKGGSHRCGMNSFWSNCATTCPDTCQNYGSPRPCTLMCKQGCTCNDGYVLERSGSSRCVPISHCPGRKYGSRYRNVGYYRRNNNYNNYYG